MTFQLIEFESDTNRTRTDSTKLNSNSNEYKYTQRIMTEFELEVRFVSSFSSTRLLPYSYLNRRKKERQATETTEIIYI